MERDPAVLDIGGEAPATFYSNKEKSVFPAINRRQKRFFLLRIAKIKKLRCYDTLRSILCYIEIYVTQ